MSRFLVNASMPSWIDFLGEGKGMFSCEFRDFMGDRGDCGWWMDDIVIALMMVRLFLMFCVIKRNVDAIRVQIVRCDFLGHGPEKLTGFL